MDSFRYIESPYFRSGDIEVRFDVMEGGTLEIAARLTPQGLAYLERHGANRGMSGYEVFGQFIAESLMAKVQEALEEEP